MFLNQMSTIDSLSYFDADITSGMQNDLLLESFSSNEYLTDKCGSVNDSSSETVIKTDCLESESPKIYDEFYSGNLTENRDVCLEENWSENDTCCLDSDILEKVGKTVFFRNKNKFVVRKTYEKHKSFINKKRRKNNNGSTDKENNPIKELGLKKEKEVHYLISYFKKIFNTFIVDSIKDFIVANEPKLSKAIKLKCYKIKYKAMTNNTSYYPNKTWLSSTLKDILIIDNPKNVRFLEVLGGRSEKKLVELYNKITHFTYEKLLDEYYDSRRFAYLKTYDEKLIKLDIKFKERKKYSFIEKGGYQRFFNEE